MSERIVIGDQEALAVRQQWEREVLPKIERDRSAFDAVRALFQQVSEGRLAGAPQNSNAKKRDLAEERRAWFSQYLGQHGFPMIVLPRPNVSNREFARREKLGWKLFFNPITSIEQYHVFMTAVGQAGHWTLVHDDRNKINWEFSATGYWFWAEVPNASPRLKIPWNTLSTTIRLLSLEEYVIVWHTTKAETQVMLDGPTYCWLRTRYNGSGALRAGEDDGGVVVSGNDAELLSGAFGYRGGRFAEVVQN